ncbi:LPXTG cell wall anchor domain-containing protein, partial [Corynebacterium otitidis]|uniref:LPXTG cell wall anchor domain-containing protein n=1 Tax=Corynebacterium otitidis TaxID=29321 RepID=UPI000ABA263B
PSPAPSPRGDSAQAGAGSGSLASTGVSGVLGVLAFGLALSAAGAAGLVASRRQQEA